MAREPNASTDKCEPDGCVDADVSDLGVARGEVIGRYTLHARIAAGGMASVYLGSLAGVAEFSRLVAIKRMHPQFAVDPEFSERFRDEARLTARLLHPNIVQSLDVLQLGRELLLIMEYVEGVTLNSLCHDACASNVQIPLKIVSGIVVPVLHGLHAAHVATDDDGRTLGIVHRDFSPQNIIIGRNGHAKILDFGIAKARTHQHITVAGQFSGKFGYLSPEQISGKEVDQRTDVFAAGVVLWELLTCKRLFREPGLSEGATVERVLNMEIPRPSQLNSLVDGKLDEIVLRALQREPSQRFATAHELAAELESLQPIASPSLISGYLSVVSAERLARLSQVLATVRRSVGAAAREAAAAPPQRGRVGVGETDVLQTVVSAASNRESMATELNVRRGQIPPRAAPIAIVTLLIASSLFVWLRSSWTSPSLAQWLPRGAASSVAQETSSVVATSPLPAALTVETMTVPVEPRDGLLGNGPDAGTSEGLIESTRVPASQRHKPAPRPLRSAGTAQARTSSAKPAATAATCDPPTYVDAGGIKHFKAGCL